ncbi:hypothetical protein KF728_22230 [Candidatus Obscuribacterales bacterium]|nr:hypothetical protein [Candidatus Obscuribacterales bacterium]
MRRGFSTIALGAFMLLGVTGIANAYTCNEGGSPPPGSVSGDLTLSESGSCTLSNPISATGTISISAAGNITTDAVSAGGSLSISTSAGTITTDNLTANSTGVSGGNILLTATGNVKTKNLTTVGTTRAGAIEINANTSNATSTPFTIGASTANGVNGSLNTSSTTGGGSSLYNIAGGIFIKNGTSSATGGITVSSASNINVKASASRSGFIILDAKSGTITLPAGNLSTDGPSGYGSGSIILMASTITTADGTVLSASQTSAAPGTNRVAMLAANTINVSGSTGLEIRSNGNGVTGADASAVVALLPKGAISYSSSGDPLYLVWLPDSAGVFSTTGNMKVTGSGALRVSANGDYTRVFVSGSPIIFENGAVTLEAKGATSHEILFYNAADPSGPDVTFSNPGNVTIDASADTTGSGGLVNLYAHTVNMNKPQLEVKANGPSSGDGDGGKVAVSTSWDTGSGFVLNANSKAIFSANAASAGSGNAIYSEPDTFDPKAIQFYAGGNILQLGTDNGQYSFFAKGGADGGDGGAVVISGSEVQLKKADAVKVDGLAGDGKGGLFQSYAYITNVDSTNIIQPVITATGHGNGRGGKVQSWHSLTKFDVLKFIKVDGGSTLEGTDEAEFGWITLNNVVCQQRTTDSGNFPTVYWNCVNPGSSLSLDKAPEDVASSTLSSRSGTERIKLFVFNTLSDYAYFFSYYDFTNRSGETWEATESTPNIYSSVWETNPISPNPTFSEPTFKETAIHELGHAFDHLIGQSSQSEDTNLYQAYVFRDFLILDYAKVDPSSSAYPDSVKRNPCTATPNPAGGNFPEPAPFLNAIDLDGEYICHGANVTVAGTTLNSKYSSLTFNHSILQHPKTGQYWFTSVNPLWNELYAQALAYEAFALGNGTFAYSVPDNLFNNGVTAGDGYFHCVRNWAQRVRDGHNTPSAGSGGSGCSAPVPGWYSF